MSASGLLLDSDVLAEIRKATPDPKVVAFLRRRAYKHLYISVLSVGELKGLYPYPEPTDGLPNFSTDSPTTSSTWMRA